MMRIHLAVVALLVCAPAAVAQNLTLNTPGSYILGADSTSTEIYNIVISASDVVFDLNGRTVRCQPSNPATAVTIGVAISGARVTVKNGTVTGCFFGVHGGYGDGVTLQDLNLSGNTYIGANLGYSVNTVVRRVTCNSIGGYTAEAYAICINGIGDYGLIESSTFRNIYRQSLATGTGEGVAILVEQGAVGVTVRNNVLTNDDLRANTIGIWSANGTGISVTGNTITNFHVGIQGSGFTIANNTIALNEILAGSTAISAASYTASNNTIRGYDTALSGGIADGGGNLIEPLGSTPAPAGRWFRFCVDSATQCYEGYLPPAPGGGGV